MQITILTENPPKKFGWFYKLNQWGLSLVIDKNNERILFDTGHSNVYLKNSGKLKVDLNKVRYIALSHHHRDHAEGLFYHKFTNKLRLILHPDTLKKIPTEHANKFQKDFDVVQAVKPYEIVKDVYFLGQIPRKTSFEKGMYLDDPMLDDSAIAIKSSKGLIVITGCSHSGICNICEYAKEITRQPIYAIIGGFHLFENDGNVIEKTINYFKKEKPEKLYPMHCVDAWVMEKFKNEFGVKKLTAGDSIELPD